MRYLKTPLLLVCLCPLLSVQAQFGKKLKEKLASVTEKVTGATENSQNQNTTGNTTGGSSAQGTNNNPRNSGGAGLISTPPDVQENLVSAETSFGSGKYSEARYAVQQAMLGVELQIGQDILKSLPKSIAGLKYDSTADQVTSSGWGWAGLTIYRQYTGGDRQLKFSVANNAAWMQAVNLYFTGGYAQQTGGQQNWKQTKIKGLRAIIEYNESTGYKLSAPLGQTSLLIYEGINFANEGDFMKAAENIDVDKIKKQLGEN
jgi:hypothetical protein